MAYFYSSCGFDPFFLVYNGDNEVYVYNVGIINKYCYFVKSYWQLVCYR